MRDRIIFGAIGAVLLVILLFSDSYIVNIAVTVVSFMALLEVYNALQLTKNIVLKILGLALSFASTYVMAQNVKTFFMLLFMYIIAIFLIYMLKPEITLSELSKVFFITLYICLMFSCIVIVRKMPYGEHKVWMIFLSAYVTDTFAYFIGKFFGKHHPFKRLSPKKTTEGVVAGITFCLAAFFIHAYILKNNYGLNVNYVNLTVTAVLSSGMGIFGDLAASRIKREFNLKDFSGLIPGHGGIMDRFDSVLFTAPAIFLLANLLPII